MAPPLLASRALVLQGAAVLPVLVGCRVRSSVGARAAARTARWLWATKGRGALPPHEDICVCEEGLRPELPQLMARSWFRMGRSTCKSHASPSPLSPALGRDCDSKK